MKRIILLLPLLLLLLPLPVFSEAAEEAEPLPLFTVVWTNGVDAPVDLPQRNELEARVLNFLDRWRSGDSAGLAEFCAPSKKEGLTEQDLADRIDRLFTMFRLEEATVQLFPATLPDGCGVLIRAVLSPADAADESGDESGDESEDEPAQNWMILCDWVIEDGVWYLDLSSAVNTYHSLTADGAPTAQQAQPGLLYYNPYGGSYYHLDPNCPKISPWYLPLTHCFTVDQLDEAPYAALRPCRACGAPERQAAE